MIKLNLNKTRTAIDSDTVEGRRKKSGQSTVLTGLQSVLAERMESVGPGFIIKLIVNVVLILCFPLGLKIYEVQQINKLKAQKEKEELLLNETNQQLSILKTELNRYGYLKGKSEEFIRKKEFLSQLTKERLDVPRILDFIQDNLPKTVWLKKIQVDVSNKENTRVEISGESFKEISVNVFASSLEQILNGNSITVNMRDVKEGNSVVKVNFDLKGEI